MNWSVAAQPSPRTSDPHPRADLRAIEVRKSHDRAARRRIRIPAWVVEQSSKRIRVFDLSSHLPVLRTFKPGDVKLTPGSTWTHASAITGYTDCEPTLNRSSLVTS
jgi:hypothetical protein